ncbi:peptide deformylase [Candidatus Falkowbacteria bacterium]|nr:peptide deformylase [Candidatus Falkowbacteria bacterium]
MLTILTLPNKSLHERSSEIELALLSNKPFQSWLRGLNETMHERDGVGLSAPQVGRNIRICTINRAGTKLVMDDKHEPTMPHDLILINPVWKKISRKQKKDIEGCLSVPGFYGKVKRYHDILVEAIDEKGKKIKFEAHGFFARVVQHEVDHLDGILFVDRTKEIFKEKNDKN